MKEIIEILKELTPKEWVHIISFLCFLLLMAVAPEGVSFLIMLMVLAFFAGAIIGSNKIMESSNKEEKLSKKDIKEIKKNREDLKNIGFNVGFVLEEEYKDGVYILRDKKTGVIVGACETEWQVQEIESNWRKTIHVHKVSRRERRQRGEHVCKCGKYDGERYKGIICEVCKAKV